MLIPTKINFFLILIIIYVKSEEYIYPKSKFIQSARFQNNFQPNKVVVKKYLVKNNNRLGFYNVQTGDEFFLHDFDVTPKFKTKQTNKDVMEYQYSGYTTKKSTTFRPIINEPTNKPTRKVVRTTKRSQIYNNNRRKNGFSTTKKPNYLKKPNRKQNKNKIKNNFKQKYQSSCQKNKNNNKIRIKTTKKPGLKLKSKNKFNKSPKNNRRGERKMFSSLSHLTNSTKTFTNQFLSLFTIVQFDHFECSINNDINIESEENKSGDFPAPKYRGVCVNEARCFKLGGFPVGECANGMCCVFRKNCGESTNRNLTYLESPNYPNFYPNKIEDDEILTLDDDEENEGGEDDEKEELEESESNSKELINFDEFEGDDDEKEPRDDDLGDLACIFWVDKASRDVQLIRIDFIDFELMGPSENGDCLEEKFVVSGQNLNNIPIICGYNSGQHYYIDVNALKGPLQLSILSTSSFSKRYKLLITQFSTNCNNNNNCLQYFDSISGVIQSFNYESSELMRSQPQYLNNLNYAICIKKSPGFCSISYEIDQNEFDLINENESCENDYIVLGNTRICNEAFTTSITDNNPGPIVINVRSDEELTGRGFKIIFRQNEC